MSEQPPGYNGAPVSLSTKVGHSLANVLGIELKDHTPYELPEISRGESVYSVHDTYIEEEPTVLEFFSQFKPTGSGIAAYLYSFLPVLTWAGRYNLKWLTGDMIAGITVGCVVIPQGSELFHALQRRTDFNVDS